MAASALQLEFGPISPAWCTGLSPISADRRMQGFETMSHLARKLGCRKGQESCGDNEQHEQFLCEQFLSDPTQWWDNRGSNLIPRHSDFVHKESKVALRLDNWQDMREDAEILRNRLVHYKSAWVGSRLAMSMTLPPESVLSAVQVHNAFGRVAEHDDLLEVDTCRKLCEDGRITEVVDALNLLVQRGCHVPNNVFYRVLKGCIAHKDLVLGRQIHALTVKSGYEGHAFLATHLMSLYASHGRLEEASQVFAKVSVPTIYNWTTIIFAYDRHGEATQVIRLYQQMCESTAEPNNHIYVAVLKACATTGDLVTGREVHSRILASPGKPDIFVQTGLVDMYAKCRSLEDARRVFDKLSERNVVTWTAMIAGYTQQGMGEEGLRLYNRMQQEGITAPNSFTFACLLQACASVGLGALHQGRQLHAQIDERGLQNDLVLGTCLIDMYAKCGSLEKARRIFDRLPDKDVVTWNAMLAGYAQQGMAHEALSLYSSMQQGGMTSPNSVTFVCLLQACATVAALPLGQQLHAQIEERGLQPVPAVGAALVNMYAKCGNMCASQQVFDSLPERTIEAWGALTGGYTRQGDSEVVFDLLDRMRLEGIQPDGATFLSVLTVCSHVGLVDKGRKYFEAMTTDHGIHPTAEHYTCMMDLLGRSGHLHDALALARSMPFTATGVVWLTLLGACQKWNNIEIGQQAFEFAVNIDGKDAASYALMSNIYASAEMWEEAREMKARRIESGAWKKPGRCWWTDTAGVVHSFL